MNLGVQAEQPLLVAKTRERSKPPRRWRRPTVLALVLTVVLGLFLALIANLVVVFGSEGDSWNKASDARHADVAIVPGAMVNPDGTLSLMLADRVDQAAALFHAGKVEKVLVSGDHGRWAYDEPTSMRRALVAAGVPAEVIFTDHAGFNTHATMERAKRIFGVTDAIIVTQGFHMERSLYLAHSAGIKADGLTSDLHGYGGQGLKSDVREVASRVKAVVDVWTGAPVVGGDPISLDGPARASWGPEAPAGTPPAGAPSK